LNGLVVLYRQLEDLATKLPLSSNFQDFPASLQSLLTKFSDENPFLAESLKLSYSDEPWRQFVLFLQGKLPVTTGEVEEAKLVEGGILYRHPYELEAHLALLSDSLHESGAGRLADTAVSPVSRALDAFGFHLASLDIRQNSHFHDLAIDQLLKASGIDDGPFSKWDEERRIAFLENELLSPRPFIGADAPAGHDPSRRADTRNSRRISDISNHVARTHDAPSNRLG
jgi:phosphoenolpyruvate carboxylase